ncbi:MAG: deoxyribose-phosphate aldolase [Spirochaetales bacterium]|jgi:deoxyribose-phosphate aldolase|nr:deoxyribose-phosphate aldolase [Spirochaetales bacterium]VBB40291.1 Deoxyribose-phosphate aldolase [uncultured Spirochaetota bacterium]HOI22175.1 deoxyribose-phosphate aldolase [Spirochaetales bacterium]
MDKKWTKAKLAAVIDHSVLRAAADEATLKKACQEAREFGFASICVNPCWVPLCAAELAGSGTIVCAVVGFPMGTSATSIKAEEARLAVSEGAGEIDVVINIGKAKSEDWNYIAQDIAAVVKAAKPAKVKTIIETCVLDRQEKILACRAAAAAGADYVQTSTGFGTGGALVEDIVLMRQTLGGVAQVKAAGGIRTRAECIAMLEAGAERIGTSSSLDIMTEH